MIIAKQLHLIKHENFKSVLLMKYDDRIVINDFSCFVWKQWDIIVWFLSELSLSAITPLTDLQLFLPQHEISYFPKPRKQFDKLWGWSSKIVQHSYFHINILLHYKYMLCKNIIAVMAIKQIQISHFIPQLCSLKDCGNFST